MYIFKRDYGLSDGESNEPPQIHAVLIALRKKVGGLKAEQRPKVPYKVKSAATLVAKLRDAIDELGCAIRLVNVRAENVPCVPDEDGNVGTAALCEATVRITAPDFSYADMMGAGMGAATDDKALGKALTYAYKGAGVYGFTLPDADMPDTDDEAGIGPSGGKRTVSATERARNAIRDAADLKQLETVRDTVIMRLPVKLQAEMSEPYKVRHAELKASAGVGL